MRIISICSAVSGFFRKFCRIAGALLWCLLSLIWGLLTSRGPREKRELAALERTRTWASGLAKIIGLQVICHGDPDTFPGGLIVSNHVGYLDIMAHGSLFKLKFAPKAEMRKWPLLGWVTAQNFPVWIDRTSRTKAAASSAAMAEAMRKGFSMLVYAEGTSTDGEHGLLPFKSTAFEAVLESGKNILPCLTFYRSVPASDVPLGWFGDISLMAHAWHILGLKRLIAEVWIFDEIVPLPGESRKELALRVHDFLEREFWRIKNRE